MNKSLLHDTLEMKCAAENLMEKATEIPVAFVECEV